MQLLRDRAAGRLLLKQPRLLPARARACIVVTVVWRGGCCVKKEDYWQTMKYYVAKMLRWMNIGNPHPFKECHV